MYKRSAARITGGQASVMDDKDLQGRGARANASSAPSAGAVGSSLPDFFAHDDPSSLFGASIRLPGAAHLRPETVVRPALAVLFRIAVGPAADRYVRRFLAFERDGHSGPGWHWPSLLMPCVWAFYRRLWVPGLLFALLPIAGALAFAAFEPRFDRADSIWVACALLAVWILPGIAPALCADALLYLRVRRVVRDAEECSTGAVGAVKRLSAATPTSMTAAVCLGGGTLFIVLGVLFPHFQAAYVELGIRAQVAQTLAAARVLEQDIEASWTSARLLPRQTENAALRAQAGSALIDEVNVNPVTGRVRIALGPTVPELSGKTILLSPSRGADDHVQWLCVPVDIPARYLPKECRG